MELRPVLDRVIIRRKENEKATPSGIFLPDLAGDKLDEGEVLAVGPGIKNDLGELNTVSVSVGDNVIFDQGAGAVIKVLGEELLVMKESSIIAVL